MQSRARLTTAALRGVKRAAAAWDSISPAAAGIVVLIYHRVGRRSDSRVDLPSWLFEEQISRISNDPGVTTLDEALEQLKSSAPAGRPPVVVTFDDGTSDIVEVALPILVEHQVPATIYLATDFIETGRPFPQHGVPASWASLRDALSTGLVTVGSHTHSHVLLDRTPGPDAAAELQRSIELIEDRLGVEVRHFAYPKALPGTPDVEHQVRARFRSAALAGTRPNTYGRTDPYRLSRSPIQVDDGLRFFDRKAAGGMRLEDDMRRLANRRRQSGNTY